MTLITKGMGIIMKKGGGDLLKKSKKFPGPKADKQLQKKVDTRIRHGKRVRGIKGQIGGDRRCFPITTSKGSVIKNPKDKFSDKALKQSKYQSDLKRFNEGITNRDPRKKGKK